jgi:PAS domain-containing protein
VTLTVGKAEDPDSEQLTYGFRIFADPGLTRIVAAAEGISEGSGGETSWSPGYSLPAGRYFWRAYAADLSQRGMYGPVSAFDVTESPRPREAERVRAEPNPSREAIRIVYFLPSAAVSRVAIFDAQGRIVRRLPRPEPFAGWRVAEWDGLDGEGRRIPPGSYWVRVTTPEETRTARLVRIE